MLKTESLKAALQAKGWTPADLARECQVSREAVSKWLAGESLPRPKTLLKLCTLLTLRWSDLVESADDGASQDVLTAQLEAGQFMRVVLEDEQLDDAKDFGLQTLSAAHCAGALTPVEPPRLRNPQQEALAAALAHVRAGLYRVVPALRPTGEDNGLLVMGLLRLLKDFGAVVVPGARQVLGTSRSSVTVVHCRPQEHYAVLVSLDAPWGQVPALLAYAYGACLAMHKLPALEAHSFSSALAQELAGPVSPLSTPLWRELCLGAEPVSAEAYVTKLEAQTFSLAFEGLRQFQRMEQGRNHAFVKEVLRVPLLDAYEISGVLWNQTQ